MSKEHQDSRPERKRDDNRRGVFRTVAALALVALLIYLGFIGKAVLNV